MASSSSQITLRVRPEALTDPEALRQAALRQAQRAGVAGPADDDVLRIVRRSWDARKRPVMAQVVVAWGEEAFTEDHAAEIWPD